MNKYKLITYIFAFIILVCFIGTLFIQSGTEITEEKDLLETQNNITNSIEIYGYTIDNPNIIINPFNANDNSALITFETDEYVNINVNVNEMYSYTSKLTNRHYLGIYNLLKGNNIIYLSYGNTQKKLEINIDSSSADAVEGILLSNNHLLVPTDKLTKSGNFTGLREVDALGKIYYEYLLADGYKGLACEIDEEKIAILNEKIDILDRQNGNIITSLDISSHKDNWQNIECKENKIILYGENKNIEVDEEKKINLINGEFNKKYLSSDPNYINTPGVRFYEEIITKTSNEKVWLLNYSKKTNDNIKIEKEFNRIVVTNKNQNKCQNYLILDQLFNKKVYQLCDEINYIYTYNLKGKYSVYIKEKNKVYKTNNFLIFN